MKTQDLLLIGLGALLLMKQVKGNGGGTDNTEPSYTPQPGVGDIDTSTSSQGYLTITNLPGTPQDSVWYAPTNYESVWGNNAAPVTSGLPAGVVVSPIPPVGGYNQVIQNNGVTYTDTVNNDLSVTHTATASSENVVNAILSVNPGLSPAQVNQLKISQGIETGRHF